MRDYALLCLRYVVLCQRKVRSAAWRHFVTAPDILLLGGTWRTSSFLAQQRQQDLCSQLISVWSAIISIFHFGNVSYKLIALGQIMFMQDFSFLYCYFARPINISVKSDYHKGSEVFPNLLCNIFLEAFLKSSFWDIHNRWSTVCRFLSLL